MRALMRTAKTSSVLSFMAAVIFGAFGCARGPLVEPSVSKSGRLFNGEYEGANLDHVAFPLGGIGAGMVCLDGTGSLSHLSIRNKPDINNNPCTFAAICVTGEKNIARVLEGPVPKWKIFGLPESGRGLPDTGYGLPRFDSAKFLARFPFAGIDLEDEEMPLEAKIVGWSPFIPGSADNSSLPVGALEYSFANPTKEKIEAVFSFNCENVMRTGSSAAGVVETENGFTFIEYFDSSKLAVKNAFRVVTDAPATVDYDWFRGAHLAQLTVAWKRIAEGRTDPVPPSGSGNLGAGLYVPFSLEPGESKTIRVMLSWHVPDSSVASGRRRGEAETNENCTGCECEPEEDTYSPWYAGRFADIDSIADYWKKNYDSLRHHSALFRDAFYDTTLPTEAVEAVAANLTILKSPTVLRQKDGRVWGWEGCNDGSGCCAGTCTHVWNYAQAMPHLFPDIERGLRETEFLVNQSAKGGQLFRSPLPIGIGGIASNPASDGQLGGIMKVYREWRVSGDSDWLIKMWPRVKQSIDYCIEEWDPERTGLPCRPRHNTYDIEFWGKDSMIGSFYLGALTATIEMGKAMGDDTADYADLLRKGRALIERDLFNGEYFHQVVAESDREEARAQMRPDPNAKPIRPEEFRESPRPEVGEVVEAEGPMNQYGPGCLSDAVIGCWMAQLYGLGDVLDPRMVNSTLRSIHKYNFIRDLSKHACGQRPGFAQGDDGGLLLCSWPRGGKPTIPFPYSDEVWTGIEYQAASHMILNGMVDEGLEIVRGCRDRYDGVVRNPFNEYECGHWYARAMSSYSLIQALSGVRYDAVDKTLYIDSKIGKNFRSFLATETGFGTVGLKRGKPFIQMKSGELDVEWVSVNGEKTRIGKWLRATGG
jgi:uncharacterized protein (DUF608 family)